MPVQTPELSDESPPALADLLCRWMWRRLVQFLLGHELLEFQGGAQHGEILLVLQLAAIVEAFVEGLAEIEERLVALAGTGEGAREIVVLRDALFFGAALIDGGVRVVVEGCRVDGEGVAVCFFCVFVLFVGEVSGAEIAVDGVPTGSYISTPSCSTSRQCGTRASHDRRRRCYSARPHCASPGAGPSDRPSWPRPSRRGDDRRRRSWSR